MGWLCTLQSSHGGYHIIWACEPSFAAIVETVRIGNLEARVVRGLPIPALDTSAVIAYGIEFLKGVQLVHVHDIRLFPAAAVLSTPLVSTFHGYLTFEAVANGNTKPGGLLYRVYDWTVRKCVEMSDAVIAVDTRIEHWLRKEYSAEGVYIIPNAVDSEVFHPGKLGNDPDRDSLLPREAKTILVAKHLVPKNGLEVAVRSLPAILNGCREAILLIAGEGPLRESLQRLAESLGVGGRVRMLGQVPHAAMPTLLRNCDVCIVPSVPVSGVEEATSIFALEAMATGKPVVASRIGGLVEIIPDGRGGFLVPAGNEEALASAVVRLLGDDQMRNQMGRRAREHVVASFSWSSVLPRIIAIYEKVTPRPLLRS